MKLETLIDRNVRKYRIQASKPVTSIMELLPHPNFCNNKFVRRISLKVLMGIKYNLTPQAIDIRSIKTPKSTTKPLDPNLHFLSTEGAKDHNGPFHLMTYYGNFMLW